MIAALALYKTTYNFYITIGSVVIATYVYLSIQKIVEKVDRKERWMTAQRSFGGRNALPNFNEILPSLDYHQWGPNRTELALYGFFPPRCTYNDGDPCGMRHGEVIDKYGNIIHSFNPHTNKLDYGTWKDMVIKEAYGTMEKKNYNDAVKVIEAHGMRVVPKKVATNEERE